MNIFRKVIQQEGDENNIENNVIKPGSYTSVINLPGRKNEPVIGITFDDKVPGEEKRTAPVEEGAMEEQVQDNDNATKGGDKGDGDQAAHKEDTIAKKANLQVGGKRVMGDGDEVDLDKEVAYAGEVKDQEGETVPGEDGAEGDLGAGHDELHAQMEEKDASGGDKGDGVQAHKEDPITKEAVIQVGGKGAIDNGAVGTDEVYDPDDESQYNSCSV